MELNGIQKNLWEFVVCDEDLVTHGGHWSNAKGCYQGVNWNHVTQRENLRCSAWQPKVRGRQPSEMKKVALPSEPHRIWPKVPVKIQHWYRYHHFGPDQ